MKIKLWDSIESGIIINNDYGPTYTQQAGGTSCLSREAKGFYIPLRNDLVNNSYVGMMSDLNDYFTGPKWNGTGAVNGIDEIDAKYIDGILKKYNLGNIIVDSEKWRESNESWIHVVVNGNESDDDDLSIFCGIENYPIKAILTWPNSD